MRRRRGGLAALALALALAPGAVRAQAGTRPLRIDGARGGVAVPADTRRGYAAYPAAALESLGAEVRMTEAGARVVVFGDTLVFESLSPYFRAGAALHQLAAPFYRVGDEGYWPRQLLTEWLPGHYPRRVALTGGVVTLAGAGKGGQAERAGRTAERARTGTGAGERAAAGARAEKRLVVLDAGHGGRDPGKIGPDGVREKDVTLSIATRLAALLRGRGYEVRMTRTTDTLIALGDRPRMANDWKQGRPSALFMSIHANSFRGSARGYETYFLSDARTEDERRVAEMENAAAAYEDGDGKGAQDDVDAILNSLRNDFYVHASNDLAEAVQHQLSTFERGPDRGVKQAGFRVLVGAFMPAVLVETAFISDPGEERLLATASFQRRVAYALADAIDQFFDSHEHLLSASGER